MYNLCTSSHKGAVGDHTMALKGNLRDFSVTQLLNLVNVAQKTGTLVVERSQEQVFVSFREGKLSFARNGADAAGLTMILYHAKKLSAAQVRAINERSGGMSDKELGLLLINSNYISQQEILSSLQAYYLSMVNRLFTWSEGLFHFDNDLLPPKDKITVRISLENLIIEGTRKMREWEQLQGEIPSLEMALKFSERQGVNLRNLSLSVDEWKVISFINPKNTIHQIAKASNKNDLEIRRIVYSFIQAGLVEMVRPEGVPVIQPVQPVPQVQPRIAPPQGSKTEFKSLINRIINRIRSI
jgi:aspartate carbamoyltransferase regulatory subunit